MINFPGFLLLMIALSALSAADGGGFTVPEADDAAPAGGRADQNIPTKPDADKIEAKPEASTPAVTKVSHRPGTDAIAAYANAKGLKLTKYGAGSVRIWLVGNGAIAEAESLITTGEQVLHGLEQWTGKQKWFMPVDDDGHFHIVLFAGDGDYAGWIDQMRSSGAMSQPEGEDLVKKLAGVPISRGQVKVLGRVSALMRHYVTYAVCTAAVDVFFAERGGDSRKHSWLREGLAAEMQRLLCNGQVLCYTITYEDATVNLQQDWAKALVELIAKGDQAVRPASEVMMFSLIKMPAAYYIQMWSLCTYVRLLGKNKPGPSNLFAKLLLAVVSGTASDDAVKAVFGSEDPKLSRLWREWASQYKTDPKGLNR